MQQHGTATFRLSTQMVFFSRLSTWADFASAGHATKVQDRWHPRLLKKNANKRSMGTSLSATNVQVGPSGVLVIHWLLNGLRWLILLKRSAIELLSNKKPEKDQKI